MQVLNIFGDGQNCQNQTFKWLYQLNESKYEKSFFGKILTVMLFHMYQVFSSLLGHLHFSLHFFSTFMEQLFLNHPISCRAKNPKKALILLDGTTPFFYKKTVYKNIQAEIPQKIRTSIRTYQPQIMTRKRILIYFSKIC